MSDLLRTIFGGKSRELAAGRVFVIAEAGVNHNGDVAVAREMIDAAVGMGADAVKFQTFRSEELVTRDAAQATYQQANAPAESQYQMLKKLELSEDEFRELFVYCGEKGIMFLSTPFDLQSAVFLNELGVEIFKISSGDMTNIPFLKEVAGFGKPMILSTGMGTLEEVAEAVDAIRSSGNDKLVLLHCTTDYPIRIEDANLNAINTLRDEFGLCVGYSDHTEGTEVSLAAVAKGSCVIERHFTLDRGMKGPDHKASLEPKEFTAMVDGIRIVEKALGDGIKEPVKSECEIMKVARKSIVAARNIRSGTTITPDMVAIKRPGFGIKPKYLNEIVGKTAAKDIPKDTVMTDDDIESAAANKSDLSYEEGIKDLSSRINIHKKFSKFEINDWITDMVQLKRGEVVLDVGCGSGKQVIAYSEAVGKDGKVIGADKNKELLEEGTKEVEKRGLNAVFEEQNFDENLKWGDFCFDLVSCCFAIYYVENIEKTLLEFSRVLKDGGRLLLCGPTENNSSELNRIHEKVTGNKVPQTAILRARRIRHEILPFVEKHFKDIKLDIFRNTISFPDAQSFMDYYSSTLLFTESVEDERKDEVLKNMYQEVERVISADKAFDLNKEVIGVLAYK